MKRRTFLQGLAGAVVSPAVVRAQTPKPPGKIGYLHPSTIDPRSWMFRIMQPAWRRLGYVEGETVITRAAQGDPTRLTGLVAELIELGADVLIMVGPQAIRAARATTSVKPIVAIDLDTDPVRSGLVQSWNNPGDNLTGLFPDQASLAGKRLALLRETEPRMKRVTLVWDPTAGSDPLESAKGAASNIGIEAFVLEVRRSEEHEAAFSTLGIEPVTGVILLGTPILVNPPHHFADAALKFKLPSITFYKPITKAGGLMSYGVNQEKYFPRAVSMAHEILKGARPSEMPVEQPTSYELVLNLRTAKALGLTIPPTLLALADEVIE
jgi:putative ABC transport system substrate-binding protein